MYVSVRERERILQMPKQLQQCYFVITLLLGITDRILSKIYLLSNAMALCVICTALQN